jgi:hypothetical protein
MKKEINKLIEEGLKRAQDHEKRNNEILNDPSVSEELKEIIKETQIPSDKVLDLTGGKRIKRIDPDTFETEIE